MRHPGQLKSLTSLINTSGTHLETLRIEASIQAQRAKKILQALPDDLNELVQVGDLAHGLLYLYVPTSAVATQLRFKEIDLLQALENDLLFAGLKRIQCRIRPIKQQVEKKLKRRAHSKTGAKRIFEYAETLKDKKLKHQFQQLAEQVSGNLESDQT